MSNARNLARLLPNASGQLPTGNIQDIAVSQAKLAVNVVPLGPGQTWQNVTASRAWGTTYTNTTGRSIFVIVNGSNNTNANWSSIAPIINGTQLAWASAISNQSQANLEFIVPAGATYSVTNSGTAAYLQQWSELR